jgi:hypothetical protein
VEAAAIPVSRLGRERKIPDPRRKETTRTAFRLLRQGAPSADLLAELHKRNNRRSNPLPPTMVDEIALWVAANQRGRTNAR